MVADDSGLPRLEVPTATEFAAAAQGAALLMNSEQIAETAAKLFATESMVDLLVRDQSFQEFMREILMVFMKTIRCEAGEIFEADAPNGVLFFRASAGQGSDKLDEVRIPIGKGIVGDVYRTHTMTCVNDCKSDSRFLPSVGNTIKFETRNLIAAPVMIRGKVFCVVEVINRSLNAEFSQEDQNLAHYLCETAAKIIEARLVMNWVAGQKPAGTAEAA